MRKTIGILILLVLTLIISIVSTSIASIPLTGIFRGTVEEKTPATACTSAQTTTYILIGSSKIILNSARTTVIGTLFEGCTVTLYEEDRSDEKPLLYVPRYIIKVIEPPPTVKEKVIKSLPTTKKKKSQLQEIADKTSYMRSTIEKNH